MIIYPQNLAKGFLSVEIQGIGTGVVIRGMEHDTKHVFVGHIVLPALYIFPYRHGVLLEELYKQINS